MNDKAAVFIGPETAPMAYWTPVETPVLFELVTFPTTHKSELVGK